MTIKFQKKKKDYRRWTAINKVKTDYQKHTNEGMEYYQTVLNEIQSRTENK